MNKACGSGGTADALASGASGGDPVEVQILSTAPFLFKKFIPKDAVVVERQTRHFEGVVGEIPCGFKSHRPHQNKAFTGSCVSYTWVFLLYLKKMLHKKLSNVYYERSYVFT